MSDDDDEGRATAADFPIVCEDCLGPNPYVRMQKEPFGGECAISGRPYTVFRWRPGNDARYKKTVVCKEIAQAKNVCQVCLLDLDYGIPVAARDAALARAANESVPSSSVNRDYAVEEISKKLAEGEDVYEHGAKEKNNELLMKLARNKPYYNKNKTPICTFWLRNACTRNDCPYRPCNGDTHMPELSAAPELRKQNIKDRYFGTNDPVAEKMLKRAAERPSRKLTPPEDTSITTLFLGGVDTEKMGEEDIRGRFYRYGDIKGIRVIGDKKCAFITFATRDGAEKAAEDAAFNCLVNDVQLRIQWGKSMEKKKSQDNSRGAPPPPPTVMMMAPGVAPPADGKIPADMPAYMAMPMPAPGGVAGGKAQYPSMDPSAMGSTGAKKTEAKKE
jgi:pre-mRNA-splicing factor RBM22/SLT11